MVHHDWSGIRRKCSLASVAGLLALGAASFGAAPPAIAQASEPTGGFGYSANFTLFGGGPFIFGPSPTVTLPDGGSATPVTASIDAGKVQQGPGILFTSGAETVSTQGTTGASGSVTTKATVNGVPAEETAGEIVYAKGGIESTCTAAPTGVSGSTTLTGPGDASHAGPTLRISDGNPDVDGDEVYVDVPTNPAPNTSYDGKLESVNDTFRVVFNEQTNNGDGSITVNAVHEYLNGPTALGNLFVGHVVCNLGAVSPDTTAPAGSDTTTTVASGTTGATGTSSGTTGSSSSSGSGMPTTGTNVLPLVFIGLELVGAGALAVRWATRRRVWPLR